MATKILEISTESAIPEFVPFGVIYYAEDTGFLWLGTGSSAPGANVVLIDSPPGGFGSSGVGDIQYNNGGELGGSAATVNAAGTINIPAGQNLEIGGNPVGQLRAKSFYTNQTAALSAAPLVAVATNPSAGMWRIDYVATVTHVDSTSFTLGGATGFQDIFTNGNGDAVVKTSNPTMPAISAANTTGTAVSGCKVGYAAAGSAITYSFGYLSGAGNGAYDIAVYAEFLG